MNGAFNADFYLTKNNLVLPDWEAMLVLTYWDSQAQKTNQAAILERHISRDQVIDKLMGAYNASGSVSHFFTLQEWKFLETIFRQETAKVGGRLVATSSTASIYGYATVMGTWSSVSAGTLTTHNSSGPLRSVGDPYTMIPGVMQTPSLYTLTVPPGFAPAVTNIGTQTTAPTGTCVDDTDANNKLQPTLDLLDLIPF